MRRVLKTTAFLQIALLCVAFGSAASAQVPIPLTVTGNVATGTIDLPGGYAADLTITFEEVAGLDPEALDVTATVVSPTDPALLARIPGSQSLFPLLPPPVTIPVAFPVLLRVTPSASSGLSFAGLYNVSLHTYNLHLDPAVPRALYKAPEGGTFRDIMSSEGIGSYRAGGGGGDFSEFLIVVDKRLLNVVILTKFARLTGLLTELGASIPPEVLALLVERLDGARSLFLGGQTLAALAEIAAFSQDVAAHSGGEEIPDVWTANGSDVNVAGLLRSAADTL